ncbi:MAG: hypothetical protein ACTS4X_00410 [Candidatus Hodgkinia cicadicola]
MTDVNSQAQLYKRFDGSLFNNKTTVGKFIFKLNHMVEDRMYYRSTSSYSRLLSNQRGEDL